MKSLEAADVHFGEVHGRLAFDDPLGQGLANAASDLNADGVETCRYEETGQGGGLP